MTESESQPRYVDARQSALVDEADALPRSKKTWRWSRATLLGYPLAVACGFLAAVQARWNGDLTAWLGDPVLVTFLTFLQGFAILTAVCALTDRTPRRLSFAQWRRWWWISGPCGAVYVVALAISVPRIGVALATVFAVAGQTVGGLALDAAGVAGRRRAPVTLSRAAGGLLAIAALAVAAIGTARADRALVLLGFVVLLVLAGAAAAVQQAANGAALNLTGDPLGTAWAAFGVGTGFLALLLLAQRSVFSAAAAAWPPAGQYWLYFSGALGVVFVSAAATVVPRIGVLACSLAIVAGALLGALGLDVNAGIAPNAGTVAASVIVLCAATLSGGSPLRRVAMAPDA